MKAIHHISSLTNSRAEMFTTDLGLAAYEGRRDEVAKALKDGVDWSVEANYLFSSAIFGQQWEIARDILRGGMPTTDSVYKEIFYWADHSLLDELPSRPDILEPLKAESQSIAFINAVIEGDLESAKKNHRPEWSNIECDILGHRVSRRPLHYAAMRCDLGLMKFLLQSGAEVNALTGEYQSALTLVTYCGYAERDVRRKCFELLRSYGGEMIPPIEGWFTNWRLSRGGSR